MKKLPIKKTVGLVATNNVSSYLSSINALPILNAEQELELAEKYHSTKDMEAAKQLALSSLRYVVPVARSYSGYGLPLGDLIQEGNVGLMKAVKRFNPKEKVRFMTFAIHWVRAEINEFIIRNWRIVKSATTKAQRKLFFKLRGKKKSLSWFSNKDASSVAKDLNVTQKDVLEMETRLYGKDMPIDMSSNDDEDGASYPILVSNFLDPETTLLNETEDFYKSNLMKQAISELDLRSREILQKRWLGEEKVGLKHLAQEYGISMERIRQIEQQAMGIIKAKIEIQCNGV